MRQIIPLLLFLILATTVAAEISLVTPREGETVSSSTRFSFTVSEGDTINTCRLFVDDQVVHSLMYNAVLRGKMLTFAMVPEEGEHTWSVECTTAAGEELSAAPVMFTLSNPENAVTVTSSGVTRGSLVHSFKIENTHDQEPIVVPRVSTGDYLEVQLFIAPSTLKKEFYVRQRTINNGVPRLWLTYRQENHYLNQGENVTLNITGSARVIANFDGMESNKAVIIFYPVPTGAAPETQEPAETEEPEPAETDDPTEPQETEEPAEEPQGTREEAEPRVGLFTRFISWLAGIFGA